MRDGLLVYFCTHNHNLPLPRCCRTSDLAPVLANTAGFLAAAAATYLDKLLAPRPQQGQGGDV